MKCGGPAPGGVLLSGPFHLCHHLGRGALRQEADGEVAAGLEVGDAVGLDARRAERRRRPSWPSSPAPLRGATSRSIGVSVTPSLTFIISTSWNSVPWLSMVTTTLPAGTSWGMPSKTYSVVVTLSSLKPQLPLTYSTVSPYAVEELRSLLLGVGDQRLHRRLDVGGRRGDGCVERRADDGRVLGHRRTYRGDERVAERGRVRRGGAVIGRRRRVRSSRSFGRRRRLGGCCVVIVVVAAGSGSEKQSCRCRREHDTCGEVSRFHPPHDHGSARWRPPRQQVCVGGGGTTSASAGQKCQRVAREANSSSRSMTAKARSGTTSMIRFWRRKSALSAGASARYLAR